MTNANQGPASDLRLVDPLHGDALVDVIKQLVLVDDADHVKQHLMLMAVVHVRLLTFHRQPIRRLR
eukprot:6631729-Prymnesium_polylepis.1